MNPRCLAAWSTAALVVVLISTNPTYRVVLLLVSLDVTVTLTRPGQRLQPLAIGLGVAVASSVLLEVLLGHQGDHVIIRIPEVLPVVGGPITAEAALYGLDVAAGIAAGLLAVAPLARAIEPHELVDALPHVLHRTATAAASALNLVPGIARSVVAVRDAQRMRGWRPRGVRSHGELLVPVVVTAMENSLQLAEAMEARGFGSGPRTRYRAAVLTAADVAVIVTALAALVVIVAARVVGLDDDWSPFPGATWPSVAIAPALACVLLVTPLLVWRAQNSGD